MCVPAPRPYARAVRIDILALSLQASRSERRNVGTTVGRVGRVGTSVRRSVREYALVCQCSGPQSAGPPPLCTPSPVCVCTTSLCLWPEAVRVPPPWGGHSLVLVRLRRRRPTPHRVCGLTWTHPVPAFVPKRPGYGRIVTEPGPVPCITSLPSFSPRQAECERTTTPESGGTRDKHSLTRARRRHHERGDDRELPGDAPAL